MKTKLATKGADTEAGVVTFRFVDGTVQSIRLDEIPAGTIRLLAIHGILQKGGDSYAGAAEAVANGEATDTVTFGKAALSRVLGNLRAGVWASRESGPSQLVRAVAEAMGIDHEEAAERIDGLEDEKVKALRKHPKVAAILARLKKEAAERKERAMQEAADEADDSGLEDLLG